MKVKKLSYSALKKLSSEKNLLPFNRDISDTHVAKMANSILQCGLLRLPVIGVLNYSNGDLVIIDGQHLISALASIEQGKKGCDVIMKEYDNKKQVISDIAKLNNTQKTWTDEDYLSAWYKYGQDNIEHFSNYAYLYNIYTNSSLSCGLLIQIYARSKDNFKEGSLVFRDRDFSDKVFGLCTMLKDNYKKSSFTLHGLRVWAESRHFREKKEIDFVKLKSRLEVALRNNEDRSVPNHRDDFALFIDKVYKRV